MSKIKVSYIFQASLQSLVTELTPGGGEGVLFHVGGSRKYSLGYPRIAGSTPKPFHPAMAKTYHYLIEIKKNCDFCIACDSRGLG